MESLPGQARAPAAQGWKENFVATVQLAWSMVLTNMARIVMIVTDVLFIAGWDRRRWRKTRLPSISITPRLLRFRPSFLGYVVLRFFISALERPQWAFFIAIAGIGLNALGNWLFIFGNWGFRRWESRA